MHVLPALQLGEQVQAVAVRKQHIEHDNIWRLLGQGCVGDRQAIGGRDYPHAVQRLFHQAAKVGIVLNDENLGLDRWSIHRCRQLSLR
jgi:hypothetical protein